MFYLWIVFIMKQEEFGIYKSFEEMAVNPSWGPVMRFLWSNSSSNKLEEALFGGKDNGWWKLSGQDLPTNPDWGSSRIDWKDFFAMESMLPPTEPAIPTESWIVQEKFLGIADIALRKEMLKSIDQRSNSWEDFVHLLDKYIKKDKLPKNHCLQQAMRYIEYNELLDHEVLWDFHKKKLQNIVSTPIADTLTILWSVGDTITWSASILMLDTWKEIYYLLIDHGSVQSWDIWKILECRKNAVDIITQFHHIIFSHAHIDHIWSAPTWQQYKQLQWTPIHCNSITQQHTIIALEDAFALQRFIQDGKSRKSQLEWDIKKLEVQIEYAESVNPLTIEARKDRDVYSKKRDGKKPKWGWQSPESQRRHFNKVYVNNPKVVCDDLSTLKSKKWLLIKELERLSIPTSPTFSQSDLNQTLQDIHWAENWEKVDLWWGIFLTFYDSGHIFWSAQIVIENSAKWLRYLFSWDLGSYKKEDFRSSPETIPWPITSLVMESTLWNVNRTRTVDDALDEIADIITNREWPILMPVISYQRLQEMICHMIKLKKIWKIPSHIPIYYSWHTWKKYIQKIFKPFAAELGMEDLLHGWYEQFPRAILDHAQSIGDFEEWIYLFTPWMVDADASSGKLLSHILSNSSSTLIMTNYQAKWRWRELQKLCQSGQWMSSKKYINVRWEQIPVHCECHYFPEFSGHGGQGDLVQYAHNHPANQTILTHRSDEARMALAERMRSEWRENVVIPNLGDTYKLG